MVHVRGRDLHYAADTDIELVLKLFHKAAFACFWNIFGFLQVDWCSLNLISTNYSRVPRLFLKLHETTNLCFSQANRKWKLLHGNNWFQPNHTTWERVVEIPFFTSQCNKTSFCCSQASFVAIAASMGGRCRCWTWWNSLDFCVVVYCILIIHCICLGDDMRYAFWGFAPHAIGRESEFGSESMWELS